jgi:hypothetical protein
MRDKAKRAYKRAEEGINQDIDDRLSTKFNLGDNMWELASNEEQMERKQERDAAKANFRRKKIMHGMKRKKSPGGRHCTEHRC